MTPEQFAPIALILTIWAGVVTAFAILMLGLTIRDSRMSDEDFLRHDIFGRRDIDDC